MLTPILLNEACRYPWYTYHGAWTDSLVLTMLGNLFVLGPCSMFAFKTNFIPHSSQFLHASRNEWSVSRDQHPTATKQQQHLVAPKEKGTLGLFHTPSLLLDHTC